jgi:hypothetical protein
MFAVLEVVLFSAPTPTSTPSALLPSLGIIILPVPDPGPGSV